MCSKYGGPEGIDIVYNGILDKGEISGNTFDSFDSIRLALKMSYTAGNS
jgi:hypothetical protein